MSEVVAKPTLWPNLSSYAVTLGIIEVEPGQKSLVFSDETGKFAHIARNMGFSRTRWPGLWVRNDVRLEANSFRSAFPDLVVEPRTAQEIAETIRKKINDHVHAVRQQELPGFSVIDASEIQHAKSVKPRKSRKSTNGFEDLTQGTGATSSEGLIDLAALSIDNVLLGFNKLGEEVFQSPDGRRFTRIETPDGLNLRQETQLSFPDPAVAGLFLRGDTQESLNIAAEGLVWAMSHGRVVRVEDFAQFFRATTGRALPKNVGDDPDFGRIVDSVDRARVRHLAVLALSPDADAFACALRLHDAAQYYSLINDSRMTPLPIGVALQHIVMSMPQGSSIRVTSQERGEFSILSNAHFQQAKDDEKQDILLGAFDAVPLERGVESFGTIVNRDDHAQVLISLEKMSEKGLGLFLVDGDQMPGRIGPSSRRFLDTLGAHFEVEGIVDVDGMLMGVPGSAPKRIIVTGEKRIAPSHPVLPSSLPYVTDYESLWRWGDRIAEAIRKPGSVPIFERGALSSQEDMSFEESYQSPYIPTSTLSEPTLMVPRNLASPLRRAMIEIQRTTPHTDQWLSEQLQMDMDELREALSPEQSDAVVLALKRMETGLGFLVGDAPGTGKGRILAAAALRQRLRGEPVVFMTEKAELFTDFWRDLENIGADRFFKNIFVINDDVKVVSPRTGTIVAKSADRADVDTVMRSMKLPPGAELIFTTYSQFNRDPVKAAISKDIPELKALVQREVSEAARAMINWANNKRKAEKRGEIKSVLVEAADLFTNPELIKRLPLEAIKPLWISRAMKNANLLLDESHNMSGEDSQTALNLVQATMRAKNVIYSSATFARGSKNMRAYRRLFPSSVDVEELHSTLKRGGEPLQEALSSMLAEDGALVRREHDLSMLKFLPQIDIKNTDRNENYANKLAEILAAMGSLSREVREYSDVLSEQMMNALKAANEVAGKIDKKGSIGVFKRSSIGNSLYTTMRSFLTVIKNDFTIDRAIANLKEGRKPGIIIEHTMEADLNRAVEKAQKNGTAIVTDEGVIIERPSFRTLLHSMLEELCQLSLDGKDLEIKKTHQFSTVVRMIENQISNFPDLPLCPLDYVRQGIEKAGYTCVELSGRKRELVDMGDGTVLVRKRPKNARTHAKQRFNNGDGDAIILTRAGNAGISLHASPFFTNTQQRVAIEAEVPEDVVVRTQFFGRFDRKDQLSHPIIETLSSNLPAENRLLALQNNKLRKMSANVTANRDNAAITENIADIINVVGNEVAFRFFENRPALALKLDVSMPDKAEIESEDFQLSGDKYVSQLFLKMVMLLVCEQREIIKEMSDEFTATIKELESLGENPLRAKFFDVHAKIKNSETLEYESSDLIINKKSSSFDKPVLITEIEYSEFYESMKKSAVQQLINKGCISLVTNIEKQYGSQLAQASAKNEDVFFEYLIDSILDLQEDLLESSLSKKYTSISEALADVGNNMVKSLKWRMDRIIETLSELRIGSVISFTDDNTGLKRFGVVVDFEPPCVKDVCLPGRYFVNLAIPGLKYVKEFSFNKLINDTSFSITERAASEKMLDEFSDKTNSNYSYSISRNVLNGNPFRAAELSIQSELGVQAIFSDEHGMSNRAVVLPRNVDKKSFVNLPIRISDVNLAARFLMEMERSTLVSTPAKVDKESEVRGIVLMREKNNVIMALPGSTAMTSWLKNNHDIMSITGPFAGSRNRIFASIPFSDVDKLIPALYQAGITLYAHSTLMAAKVVLDKTYGHIYRSMPPKEYNKKIGLTDARSWFAKEMQISDVNDSSLEKSNSKDLMAEFDTSRSSLKR